MSEGINLITARSDEAKKPRFQLSPSLLIFGVTFIIAAIIVLYSLFLRITFSSLSSQGRTLTGQISSLSLRKQKMLVVNERLSSIRTILSERSSMDATIQTIVGKMTGSSIDSITATNNEVSVTISSQNLAQLAKILSERIPELSADKELGAQAIIVDNFVRSDNEYSLSLNFKFKPKKI